MQEEFVFAKPDKRFAVAYIRLPVGRSLYLFAPTTERRSVGRVGCRFIPGTQIVLFGDVDEALAGLIDNYSSAELREMLEGISFEMLTLLRRYLGIADDLHGRGGPGRKQGRKKRVSPSVEGEEPG